MKKIGILILVLIFILSCDENTVTEIPVITIMSGDTNIDYEVGLSTWDGVDYDREDIFIMIRNNGFEALPYIKLGSEFHIKFEEKVDPEKIVLYDYVLDESLK